MAMLTGETDRKTEAPKVAPSYQMHEGDNRDDGVEDAEQNGSTLVGRVILQSVFGQCQSSQ